MSYMNTMWAAAGVAMVNSVSDQGQKVKSSVKSLNYGKQRFFSGSAGPDGADLRPLSAILSSDPRSLIGDCRRGDELREQKDESLRQVMYMNCWGQS